MFWNYICLSKLTLKVWPLYLNLVTRAGDMFHFTFSLLHLSMWCVLHIKITLLQINPSTYAWGLKQPNNITTQLSLWPFFEIWSLWFYIFFCEVINFGNLLPWTVLLNLEQNVHHHVVIFHYQVFYVPWTAGWKACWTDVVTPFWKTIWH